MLKAGHTYKLTISRISDYGVYLTDGEKNEVLLPNRYTSLADKAGDEKEVFIYHDSEDRLVATTETPLLRSGETGYLEVVDKTAHGAFLDWGLHGKDLFLPNRNQQGGILVGHRCIVYLYEDNITGRCVATCKLKSFINNDLVTVEPRQQVQLLVASESPIGYRVIIDNRHWGMLYRNQLFRPVSVGDKLTGYVRRITEDNRIDVSLQQEGYAQERLGRYPAPSGAGKRRSAGAQRRQYARRGCPPHGNEQESVQTLVGHAAEKRQGDGKRTRNQTQSIRWPICVRPSASRRKPPIISYSNGRCWPIMPRQNDCRAMYWKSAPARATAYES